MSADGGLDQDGNSGDAEKRTESRHKVYEDLG